MVIYQDDDRQERIIALHQRGDFFGKMALLDGKKATTRVVVMEDKDSDGTGRWGDIFVAPLFRKDNFVSLVQHLSLRKSSTVLS